MILESIVTTLSEAGRVNIAPMGPLLTIPSAMRTDDGADPGFVLRPFEGSRTFENLMATRRATIHVTDDVGLFASAAIGRDIDPDQTTRKSPCGHFAILRRCHRWFAVEVASVRETPPRYEMKCRVVDSGIEAPFFGFNRAKHAVIEAAILATRTHLLDADDVNGQMESLRPLIEKTAGRDERDAFVILSDEIDRRLKQASSEERR